MLNTVNLGSTEFCHLIIGFLGLIVALSFIIRQKRQREVMQYVCTIIYNVKTRILSLFRMVNMDKVVSLEGRSIGNCIKFLTLVDILGL